MNIADPIIQMIQDMSGLWDITDERVEIIRASLSKLSHSNQRVANEMLDTAANQHIWLCKAEYYTVLMDIRRINESPTREEVLNTIRSVTELAATDRIDHREWFKDVVNLLHRIANGM